MLQIRKELYIVDEEQKHVQFAKAFLVGWDNSLSNEQVLLYCAPNEVEWRH